MIRLLAVKSPLNPTTPGYHLPKQSIVFVSMLLRMIYDHTVKEVSFIDAL